MHRVTAGCAAVLLLAAAESAHPAIGDSQAIGAIGAIRDSHGAIRDSHEVAIRDSHEVAIRDSHGAIRDSHEHGAILDSHERPANVGGHESEAAGAGVGDSHRIAFEVSHEIEADEDHRQAGAIEDSHESQPAGRVIRDSHEPAPAAGGQAPKAGRLTLVVFTAELPAAGIGIALDGAPAGRTDRNGHWQRDLPPGPHRLQVEAPDQTYRRDLDLAAGEIARLLLNFYPDGRPVYADFETSNPAAGRVAAEPSAPVAAGPPGILEGIVTGAEDRRPLAGVRVFASGVAAEIVTGEDGRYRFELPPGNYALSVLAARFNTRTLDNIPVTSGQTTTQNLELTPAGAELPEFVVLAPYIEGSIASVMEERRSSASVTEVLGAEQISRAGDSDAASALKRVTGLTLVNDRFIFIRGLGERYTTTLLNGATVPSPDPTRRVVPLDLFPADVLASVLVTKSFDASLPGDFGGGTIDLRTQTVPDEFLFNISGSFGVRTSTSFKSGFSYDGGDFDFLGFDDGTRALPGSLQEALDSGRPLVPVSPVNPNGFSREEIQQLGRDLSGVYDIERKRIRPDTSLAITLGDTFHFGNDWQAGFLVSGSWDEEFETRDDEIRRDINVRLDNGEQILGIENDFIRQFTEQEVSTSLYGGANVKWRDQHEITATTLLLRQTFDLAEITEGFSSEVNDFTRQFELEYVNNKLFVKQFGGHHTLPFLGGLQAEWQYTQSTANRTSPNERLYRFDVGPSGDLEFSIRADNNSTVFSNLYDDSSQIKTALVLPLQISDKIDLALAGGIDFLNRNRLSIIRRFRFAVNRSALDPETLRLPSLEQIFSDENITPTTISLQQVTRPTDSYTAEQDLDGFFGSMTVNYRDTLEIVLAGRVEDNLQRVETFDLTASNQTPIVADLEGSDFLPAANINWKLYDNQLLRFAYSETLVRPDFREISPAPFTDPLLDQVTIGNPDLEEAAIRHADIRWEYYFSPTENFAAALFWKSFDDPIETTFFPGVTPIASFENSDTARNIGGEIEWRKSLGFIRPLLKNAFDWGKTGFLDNLTVAGNFAYIDSKLTLADEVIDLRTNQQTRLQGQSKYTVNLQLGYETNEQDMSATLLYNTFGARIVQRGLLGAPDIEEQPFNQLDFVISKEIGEGFQLKFKARNLLNDTVKFTQGSELTRAFTRGREFSIGFSWAP